MTATATATATAADFSSSTRDDVVDAPTTVRTADDLARLSVAELERVYRAGTLFPLSALDGTPKGRMLTIIGPLGAAPIRAAIARFAKSDVFPWRGKSFQSSSADEGAGINRLILLGDQFPFDTFEEASAIDGEPCVRLDYDKPENPFFIRAIRDELRCVAPDLYLGPAMLDGAAPRLVLWFAIDKQG